MMFNHHTQEHEDGFTLVELLVVILIIGVLASVAVPAFLKQRKTAVDATVASDVKNIAEQATQTYYANPAATLSKTSLESAMGVMKTSDGTNWNIKSVPHKGFCITAWNPGGNKYASDTATLSYDSEDGGLGKKGGACAAANAPQLNLNFNHPTFVRATAATTPAGGWKVGDTVTVKAHTYGSANNATERDTFVSATANKVWIVIPGWNIEVPAYRTKTGTIWAGVESDNSFTHVLTESDIAGMIPPSGGSSYTYFTGVQIHVKYHDLDGTVVTKTDPLTSGGFWFP